MKIRTTTALTALIGLSLAVSASAQAVKAPQITHGPAINGVCVYSGDDAVGRSEMGIAAGERMRQLSAVVEAELKPEAQSLETEQASLQTLAQNKTPREQLAPKIQAFQQKAQAFEEKRNLRLKELQATQQKAQMMVAQELDAPIQAVYQERGCGMLVDRNAVFISNPAMDITQAVIDRLNTAKKTVTFDREHLDTNAQAGAAPAARPAAKKPGK